MTQQNSTETSQAIQAAYPELPPPDLLALLTEHGLTGQNGANAATTPPGFLAHPEYVAPNSGALAPFMKPEATAPPSLFTLKKFAGKHSDFTTLSALTNQVFKARTRHSSKGEIPGNGMLDFGVIVRIGRRVLIDEAAYFRWLDAQQNGGQ